MIRAAVVGLGWWGELLTELLLTSDVMQPVLGIDPSADSRARIAERGIEVSSDFQTALDRDDIDALILCSPHRFHSSQILAAASAGKHVFCEKPFGITSADAEVALDAMEAAGLQVGIGHERRFEPAVLEMQHRLKSGDLGIPLVFEGNFSQDKFLALPPDNWRLSATEAPVGPLSATGIHLVDLAISLLGTPVEVFARLSTQATTFANGDTLSVTLVFEHGRTAVINAILTTPFIGRICLIGSEGWMEIRDRSHPENSTGWDVTTVHRGSDPETRFFPPHRAVLDNLESFAKAISGGEPYPVSRQEISANVKAFEAITRSAFTGEIVSIQ